LISSEPPDPSLSLAFFSNNPFSMLSNFSETFLNEYLLLEFSRVDKVWTEIIPSYFGFDKAEIQ
jgi:hypothetical protein